MVNETQDYGGRHGPSPILGPDGRPLPRARDLTREVTAPTLMGVRGFWSEVVAAGLTPERLASILKASVDGDHRAYLQLAEDMEERDLHYAAVLGVRKRALSGIAPVVEAPKGVTVDAKVMDAVEALTRAAAFRRLVSDLLDGLSKGYSVCEIMWTSRDGLWQPAEYRHRNPAWFTFDSISRTSLRLAEDGTIDGADIPPAKFVAHVPQLKTGLPIRGGLARLAAWGFLFKRFSLQNWATFCDVYGMPLRVGKYHAGATAEERRSLLRAVTQIATDAGAIIPESMTIDFVDAKPGAQHPFEALARYCDEQLSKAVLGQTMTSDNGSSQAQATVHNEIRIELLEDDSAQMSATIARDLVSWFVALNFGENAPRPEVLFPVQKPEDVNALSTALEKLVPLGLKVSQAQVRERLGLSAPDDDEDALTPPKQAEPASTGGDEGRAPVRMNVKADKSITPKTQEALNALGRAAARVMRCEGVALNSEGLDADLDDIALAGAEDWRAAVSPVVAEVKRIAASSSTFEEFLSALDRLTPDMSALEREMFAALMKARGISDG